MITTKNYYSSLTPLFTAICLLVLLAFIHRWQISPIAALNKTVSAEFFSAGRAYEMLERINPQQLAHPADSYENRLVEQGIVTLLRDMGYQEKVQEIQVCDDFDYGVATCLKVRNIIVHIKGTEQNSGILLSAHYDSVPAGPGASDAGAAVGTLLEIARLLADQGAPRNSIVLLFNEGEENGLKGAKGFMTQHPLAKQLQLAINIEARGTKGQSIMFETGEDSGWLVEQYSKTTPALFSSSMFYEAYKYMPNSTDLTIYKDHGLQGLNFAHAENLAHYHTKLDNFANFNLGSLQHHGDNVWGIVKAIKDSDISQVKKGNLVFTDVFGLFMVQWYESYSLTLSLALVALFILVYYFRTKICTISVKSLLKATSGTVVIIILSAAMGYLLQEIVIIIGSSNTPWWSEPLLMRSAIWAGVILTALLISIPITRKSSPIDLTLGLLLTWVSLSVLTSVFMPGVSYLFTLPAAIALLSMLVINCVISKVNVLATAVTAVITSLAIGIIFVPVVYSLEVMLSFDDSLVIALSLGFVTSSFIPLIAFYHVAENSNKTFGTKPSGLNCMVSFFSFILLTTLGWVSCKIPFTASHPQGLNFEYLQQADHKAYLVVDEDKVDLPAALRLAMADGKYLAVFPWSRWQPYVQEVKSSALSSAEMTIIETKLIENKLAGNTNSGREVILNIKAKNKKLSAIELFIGKSSGLVSINNGINTVMYHQEKNDRTDFFKYQCLGVSCAKIQLILTFDNEVTTKLMLAKVTKGLPTELKPQADRRGDVAVQSDNGDVSYVLSEIEL